MNKLLTVLCLISIFGCAEDGTIHVTIPRSRIMLEKRVSSIKRIEEKHADTCNKPVVIAVIDTGFGAGWAGEETAHLCKFGHKDFTGGKLSDKFHTVDQVPVDHHGHGTHIVGTIDQYAGVNSKNYCIVVLKYYDPAFMTGSNIKNTVEAIKYAKNIHADFINYSSGGNTNSEDEILQVKEYLDAGGTFVAAAGNDGVDIGKYPYYPAQDDDRVIVVGNGPDQERKVSSSNYGERVDYWENGKDVKTYNYLMTGTSQSTAIETGKLVAEKIKSCK
jgi:serine protease